MSGYLDFFTSSHSLIESDARQVDEDWFGLSGRKSVQLTTPLQLGTTPSLLGVPFPAGSPFPQSAAAVLPLDQIADPKNWSTLKSKCSRKKLSVCRSSKSAPLPSSLALPRPGTATRPSPMHFPADTPFPQSAAVALPQLTSFQDIFVLEAERRAA